MSANYQQQVKYATLYSDSDLKSIILRESKNRRYRNDYRKIYAGINISNEVLKILNTSERQLIYTTVDIKHPQNERDNHGNVVMDEYDEPIKVPSKEISIDEFFSDGWKLPGAPSAEEIYIQENEPFFMHEGLIQTIKSLNETDRELLFLYYVDKRTQHEIAEILGQTQQTVSRHINKISQRIRASI